MDFRRLAYFCAIVEEGSISAAAKRLNISQPPLSLRLKELEDEIGIPLILRTRGRWSLTDPGRNLYQRGQHLLKQLDRLPKEIKEFSDPMACHFSIAVTQAAYFYLLSRLAGLFKNNPFISARILATDDNRVEQAIQAGTADIGISLLPLKFNNYNTINLKQNGYIVVYPQSIQLPDKDVIVPDDIKDYPLMLLSRWEGVPIKNLLIRNAFRQLGVTPNVRLETSDPRHILDLISRGVEAVGIIHDCYLGTTKTNLMWKPFYLNDIYDEVVIIWRKDLFINNSMQKIIDVLSDTAND